MQRLNFPEFDFRLKNSQNGQWIFDLVRKKYVMLQPEEWVRQHVLHYLINNLKYPKGLIGVEKQITVKGLKKRYDIVVYDRKGEIFLLVECKAPNVVLNQSTFDQIAIYNLEIQSRFLMLTNGLKHWVCQLDKANRKYNFLENVPEYQDITPSV